VVDDINRLSGLSAIIDKDQESFSQKLERGMSLQALANMSDATLSKMYRAAKRLYDMKLFEESAAAFVYLTNLNPEPHALWKGLGNAEYCLKHYEDALNALEAAVEADPADPTCFMIMSRCHLQLGNIQEAINAIDRTLETAGERPEYQHWKAGLEQEKLRLHQKLHT
jgi:tetratricopeptide (TPR) repeat protein